jgi:hypothetical protein
MNETFMDTSIVNPMISSNIILPTVVIFAFSVFFIPYAHISFNTRKAKDYGILETIGIDNNSIRNLVILENSIIAAVALACGVILGTIISLIFFKASVYLMGIHGLKASFEFGDYEKVVGFFVLIDILTIAFIAIRTSRATIKQLLYDERKMKTGHRPSLIWLIVGIAMILIPVCYLLTFFEQDHSNMMMICFAVTVIGLFIVVSNSMYFIDVIKRKNRKKYYENEAYLTGIKYKFGTNKKIFYFTICLMAIALFFQIFAFSVTKLEARNIDTYYPYHIAYTEYAGENYPSTDQINSMAEKYNMKLVKNTELKYISNGKYAIMSAQDIGQLSGQKYKVDVGDCIVYSEYDTQDGYPHYDKPTESTINISGQDFKAEYAVQKIENKVVMNDYVLSTDYCAVINSKDFDILQEHAKSSDTWTVRVVQCGSVAQSKKLVNEISSMLKTDPGNGIGEMSSKYSAMQQSEQSCGFLLFVLTTMGVLLFLSNIMMIHFKLLSNIDLDRKRYNTMWNIGFSFDKIHDTVEKDIRTVMLLPVVIAVIFAGVYDYSLCRLSDTGGSAMIYTITIGGGVLLLQNILSCKYAKRYMRALF